MHSLKSSASRKVLFACLYFSEGAPIGFLWLALPTRLRSEEVPIEQITWLTAVLVIPWTFKFLWAPILDVLQSRRWTRRHWIVTAQSVMGIALVPLLVLDPVQDFHWMAAALLIHAFAAATQDVAIDSLCIALTEPQERGEINGWMQLGMLLGRAGLGGGALWLSPRIGDDAVVGLLILATTFSMALVIFLAPTAPKTSSAQKSENQLKRMWDSLRLALGEFRTWLGLLYAFLGGAAFKALEVVYGPFLIDRGFTEAEIGEFAALPMIGLMVLGALLGGRLSDRFGRRAFVAFSMLWICVAVVALAWSDRYYLEMRGNHLLICLAAAAFGIGLFTSSSYAMFMDITNPAIAATQFSAYMGMTNGCESWSTFAAGQIIADSGYSLAFLVMCGVSLAALPLLLGLAPETQQQTDEVNKNEAVGCVETHRI